MDPVLNGPESLRLSTLKYVLPSGIATPGQLSAVLWQSASWIVIFYYYDLSYVILYILNTVI